MVKLLKFGWHALDFQQIQILILNEFNLLASLNLLENKCIKIVPPIGEQTPWTD